MSNAWDIKVLIRIIYYFNCLIFVEFDLRCLTNRDSEPTSSQANTFPLWNKEDLFNKDYIIMRLISKYGLS